MRIVMIGGTGHVGTYLVPRLVEAGHEVICVSRGESEPYQFHSAWGQVQRVTLNRDIEEQEGKFGKRIQEFEADAVIDMICFTPQSARQLVTALRGRVQHLLVCGTIWIHGRSRQVPTEEAHNRNAFEEYGIQKEQMTAYLLDEARCNRMPITVLHPGHIVGPGWIPVNPLGNFNPQVFTTLARGDQLAFPTLGMETLHHVHADDVAQAFEQTLTHWSTAVGEDFHVTSGAALTLRGYAEAVASWFGQEPYLTFLAGDEWKTGFSATDIEKTWEHLEHSPNCSIDKARKLLDYQPRYTSLAAIYEALQWLIQHEVILP